MTLQDSNEIEALLQQTRLEHQTADHSSARDAQPTPVDGTENLLSQLKENHHKKPQQVSESSLDYQIDLEGIRLTQKQKEQAINQAQTQAKNLTDDLLTQLRNQHQTQEDDDSEYEVNVQEICLAEQQKQQQNKRLTEQAKVWLEKLDPYSDEGFWFSQFAESYESRLAAAIDYLSALES